MAQTKLECSFCCKTIPEGSRHAVAGPAVFICRDCIGLCIELMAMGDPEWRDAQIEKLSQLNTKENIHG